MNRPVGSAVNNKIISLPTKFLRRRRRLAAGRADAPPEATADADLEAEIEHEEPGEDNAGS
jgi:hypothetical protein